MNTRDPHNTGPGARRGRSARRPAFTLVEIIVAVGLLAIVGVVVGTIFASVGETVTQGRQVSNLNRFAARVERVMRRDFESMVRENGFLVIRHELSNDPGDLVNGQPAVIDVALTATDASDPDRNGTPGRPRRVDELMFFSRGEFTSRRTPLHRSMVAKSNTARVYYGHGQRRPVDFGDDPASPEYDTRYARPRIDDPNVVEGARLGAASALGQINPNEFASDWSLLRHVTLLVPRAQGLQALPDGVFDLTPNATGNQGLADYNRVSDGSTQVALGPAAQGVFRAVTQMIPYELTTRPDSDRLIEYSETGGIPGFTVRPDNTGDGPGYAALIGGLTDNDDGDGDNADETLARPIFTSGIVDVAVTDLDEIRAIVTTPWIFVVPSNPATLREFTPGGITQHNYQNTATLLGFERARQEFTADGRRLVGMPLSTFNNSDYFGILRPERQSQQLWMLDALPSLPYDPAAGSPSETTGFRMRYEPIPPRVYYDPDGEISGDAERRVIAIEQADQEMLSSSVFLPRCTEFIVEWSLGIIDRRSPNDNPSYGQPIWHGLRRWQPRRGDDNGSYDPGFTLDDDQLLADLFGERYDDVVIADDEDPVVADAFSIRETIGEWIFEDGNEPRNPAYGGDPTEGVIDQEMIELIRVDQRFDNASLANPEDAVAAEYCFGFQYQDWNEDYDGDGAFDNDGDDVLRPWPWPKLVRVTMRFVDPAAPEVERTYQAEFRVPPPNGEM